MKFLMLAIIILPEVGDAFSILGVFAFRRDCRSF